MFHKSYLKKCKALNIPPLSQDDLVELCKALPKYKEKSYLQLLSYFRIGLGKMCCSGYLETQDLNSLWLMFYILEKDGWFWVDGDNKWLPLNKYSSKQITALPYKDS